MDRSKMDISGLFARRLPVVMFAVAAFLTAGLVTAPVALAQSGPTIDVWYGDDQTFGIPGEPQIWCDIQGNVSDIDGVASLSFRLNGGASEPLSIGPHGLGEGGVGFEARRLFNIGDFTVAILVDDLLTGYNTIVIEAIDSLDNISTSTVNLFYSSGNSWPPTYTTDWGSLIVDGDPLTPDPAILEQAHVIDGKWSIDGDNIRTVEPGYDRLIGLGELGWGDYEVTVPITIHDTFDPYFGVGLIFRWNGHTDDPDYCENPICGWNPLGDIGWIKSAGLNLWGDAHGKWDYDFNMQLETLYQMKMRVETGPNGAVYSLKVWEDSQIEPVDWNLTRTESDNTPMAGSILLVAHHADVSYGDVNIVPVISPNIPPVANDLATTAKFDGTSFIDILENDMDEDGIINPASVSIVSPPTNGTITGINPLTGKVEYLHGGNANPTDTFTYTVEDNDGALSNIATVTLTIQPNQPPVANDDAEIVKVGKSVVVKVPKNDTDVDGFVNPETVVVTTDPSHGSFFVDPESGWVTYNNFGGLATTDNFSYTIEDDDGAVSNTAWAFITITENVPPVANDDNAFVAFNFPSPIDVLANDTDSDGLIDPTTVNIIDPAAFGITSVDPVTGVVTYTHNGTESGADSFTYTFADDSGDPSNIATVFVTIGSAPSEDFHSDDFNSCGVDPMWNFVDPLGDAPDPVIVGGFTGDAQVAISVPGLSTHQPYDDFLGAPYIIQAAPDKDFTLEVKFSSALPDSGFAEQGVLIRQDDMSWLRFDFYSNNDHEIKLYATTPPSDGWEINRVVAAPGDSPMYMRIQRTGDIWNLEYSFNGADWIHATTFSYTMTVTGVGLFAGNAGGSKAPAFTTFVDYFSNSVDPVVEPDDQDQNSLAVTIVGNGTVDKSPDQAVYSCGDPVELTATAGTDYVFIGWSGDLTGTDNPATITMDRPRFVNAIFQSIYGQPVGVTDLASNKVMTGNPAGNSTAVNVSWTPSIDPSVVSVSVYRKGFGSYPEYDDGSGSAPVLPTDPIAEGWELVASVPVGTNSTTAAPTYRDYWYFCARAVNSFDNKSDAVMTGGLPNYLLGDVSDGGAPFADGDNSVWTEDITLLGAHYGTAHGDGLYLNTLDIGPTSDMSVEGLPATDNLIEFEDLMLFGINYGIDATATSQILAFPNVPDPVGSNVMALHLPDLPAIGETFGADLVMSGDGQIQGLKIPLVWDPDVVEPVTIQGGPLLNEQGGNSMTLSAKPGVVDVCLAGVRETGISGVGKVASVTFKRLASGDPRIQLADIDARDQTNSPVTITTTAASPVDDGGVMPAISTLHANYPNPFNPMTTIAFDLAVSGRVRIDIYSVDGRRIRTLVDGSFAAGRHDEVWNGRDQTGRTVASGTYLYIMEGPGIKQTRRMLLIK